MGKPPGCRLAMKRLGPTSEKRCGKNVKMRSIKNLGLASAALIAALMAAAPGGAHANSMAKALAKIETRGLSSVTQDRMKELSGQPTLASVATGDAQASDIVFTRAWLAKQPKPTGGSEFACLTEALYFEARGETIKGQFAVAEVIRNRVKSSRFPDSYCAVINQGTGRKYQCQFTYTCDGRPEVFTEHAAHARVAKIARATLDGRSPDVTEGATFYHTTAVRPSWSRKFTNTARFGVHLFYRRGGVRTASN